MAKPPAGTTPLQQATTFGITNMRRHILLCAGPNCTEEARGEAAWQHLKKQIAELRLDRQPTCVFRTRCHCLRVCTQGPIMVVQPDGVWYHSADPAVIDRVLQEHVLGGRPVAEYQFAAQPLEIPTS